MAANISKKELKQPDFLQVEFSRVLTFLGYHKLKVYVLLAAFLVCLIVAAGWFLYQLNFEKRALNLYIEVESSAQKSGGSESSGKLIEGYQNVVANYPRSKSALYANYQLATLYYNAGQIDLSLRAYDEFLKRAPRGNDLRILASLGQGYSYEVKKDFKKALSSFENAREASGGSYFEGQIYSDMARIYEEMKDRNKALEFYKKSLEKTTDDSLQAILKRKIASLG